VEMVTKPEVAKRAKKPDIPTFAPLPRAPSPGTDDVEALAYSATALTPVSARDSHPTRTLAGECSAARWMCAEQRACACVPLI
jgi:hypothetical protein